MHLFYKNEQEIDQLAGDFNTHHLDKIRWTHAAHLTVAIWHLKQYDLYESTCLIKSGIISYNLSIGNKNTSSEGYHETLTIFWISVVHFFTKNNTTKTLVDTCNAFLASILSGKTLPFYFYEKENILSPKARANFIPADKVPVNSKTLKKLLVEGEKNWSS